LAVDHDHEVVGVADEFHNRTASASMLDAAPFRSERLPLGVEVLIENGQGDAGQQRGQDPALRGAGPGVLVQAVLGEDACFEERLDQAQDFLVRDPPPQPVQQGLMVDLVEACGDVGLEHPPVIPDG
jgi:hypothetical protein